MKQGAIPPITEPAEAPVHLALAARTSPPLSREDSHAQSRTLLPRRRNAEDQILDLMLRGCLGSAVVRRNGGEKKCSGTEEGEEEIYERDEICRVCGTGPLVRKVAEAPVLYMVDRQAYLLLVSLQWWCTRKGGYWPPWLVAQEVSYRKCTNDEDRILSILALLGVSKAKQLRTDSEPTNEAIAYDDFTYKGHHDVLSSTLCVGSTFVVN
ncbi:hypothetical protein L7F22_053282 [Adiantum nelumboides]|nr:hypothetical protein [Adiantum nelumboides]